MASQSAAKQRFDEVLVHKFDSDAEVVYGEDLAAEVVHDEAPAAPGLRPR